MSSKAEIRSLLQNEILSLQGFKPLSAEAYDLGLGSISQSFPNSTFPLAAVHEFICESREEVTASRGFVAGLLSSVMQGGKPLLWTTQQALFPPALAHFGVPGEQVLFVPISKEKETAWVVEEALKCSMLSGVVCEMKELSFTASRRFQLAIEKSGVPLFVVRSNPKNLSTAAVSRWHIKPLKSVSDGLPGLGFSRWAVRLLKARNGRPGYWEVEWRKGRFYYPAKLTVLTSIGHRKTG